MTPGPVSKPLDTPAPFQREWLPGGEPRGAFLLLHGMESHSGWFEPLAARLTALGWAVVAFDRTGWGRSTGPRGHLDSYRDMVDQTMAIATACRQRFSSLHLAGMSWGGMATLYLGLRRGWMTDSIAMLAPGLYSKNDLPFADKAKLAVSAGCGRRQALMTPVFEPRHFSHQPEWQTFIRDDADRVRRVTAAFCIETLKMRRFCRETAGRRRLPPALCLLAGDDAIIDNPKVERLCRRAGAEVAWLPGSAHTMVLDQPETVAAKLSTHAEAALARPSRGKVWIVGGGAVGGGVASLLSFGGVDTGVLVKPAYVDRLRQDGFLLRSGYAERRSRLTVAAHPGDLPGPPDILIAAVKSFDTESALEPLKGFLGPETVVSSLQNGVGNEARLAGLFPKHPLAAASICASLEMLQPGVISWPDDRGGIGAALYRPYPLDIKTIWQDIMAASGMECRWYDGERAAERLKWSKLMLNIGFNAINSMTGFTSAKVLDHPEYGPLAVRALREGFTTMRAYQLEPVDLPSFSVSKLRFAVRLPLGLARRAMAFEARRSTEAAFSMRQDILKNRQHTEIEELNGFIVEAGKQFGVNVSANENITRLMKKFQKIT